MVVYLKDMQKQDLFPHEKVHVHEQLEIKEFPCKTPRGGEGYTWYSIKQAKQDRNRWRISSAHNGLIYSVEK